MLLLMLFLILAPAVTEAWTTGEVDAPKIFSNFYSRAISIDSSGNPHIAYGEDHLYYAYHDGSSWNYETVDSSTGVGQFASIALDSSGKVHISYYDWTNGHLKYATNLSGSWVAVTVDSSGDVGVNTSIAIDSLNNVHISYYDWINDNNGHLKYATNSSGSWVAVTVDGSGDVGLYSSIAMDSSDKVHISYYDYNNDYLKYATNATDSWVTATADNSGTVGMYTSIAMDSSDKVHISYYDWSAKDLKYATNATDSWVTATVDSTETVGLHTSIVIDSSNDLHISYYDDTLDDLKYATNSGVTPGTGSCVNTGWDCEIVDSTGNVGMYTSIARDTSDNLHISYFDSTNADLKYATGTSGSWVIGTVDSSGDAGLFTSVAIDSLYNLHISYYDEAKDDLKYATNASGSWVIETVESLGGNVGKYTSIAIDSSDKVHISYYHNTLGDLKYATNASGSLVTETVDGFGTGWVGSHTSIAIDSSNKVHISYYDGDNGDLKHATNATGSWATEMVDGSSGDVGTDTSIAIDSFDNIHISYYDYTNGDLKYATGTFGSWVAEAVDTSGDVGGHTSIAIDSSDTVHISYYKYTQLNLKYATGTFGSWSTTNVDSSGDVGLYASIAVDSSDYAHISYYDCLSDCDVNNGDLNYATNSSGSWIDETVDSSGDVGLYTSIAMDSLDNAHISYYDYNNGDLKYTTNATTQTLTVDKAGAGSGTVTSSPGGIDCEPDCSQDYISGIDVTLTPTTDPGSAFTGWSGDTDCSDGVVTMDTGKTCTATFSSSPSVTLTITKAGTGGGTVTSSPAGINCGSDCSEDYTSVTEVTLTPAADLGSTFAGWSGDPDCSDGVVTMDPGGSSKTCIATFNLQIFTLSVSKAGTCSELVTSSPPGIDCGADCSENYTYGTPVTLTASSSIGCSFDSWTDCDLVNGNECTMTVDAGKTVTANFIAHYLLTTYVSPVGTGSVSPDCSSGCWYDSGTIVIVTATAYSGYEFDYWTGCDSASGNVCTMTMDTDENVTATFLVCPDPVLNSDTSVYYDTLQEAYDEAGHGHTIKSQALEFTETTLDFNDDIDKSITIKGGYDCNYNEPPTGNTTLNGNMTINNGKVTIENFNVQ
jgi:hypothetical protein